MFNEARVNNEMDEAFRVEISDIKIWLGETASFIRKMDGAPVEVARTASYLQFELDEQMVGRNGWLSTIRRIEKCTIGTADRGTNSWCGVLTFESGNLRQIPNPEEIVIYFN